MIGLIHRWTRRSIRRHVAGELPEPARLRLYMHLRECEPCRAEFDAAAELLRAVAGRAPTATEDRRWEQRLLAELDRPATPRSAQAAPAWRTGLVAATSVAALLLVASLALWRPELPHPSGRQLRGGSVRPLVAIQIFAISASADAATRQLADGATVRLDEFIQLRYRNHDSRVRYLYLLGLDGRRRPLDYFPRPDSEQSIAIDVALEPQPLPRSIRLRARHQPGPLTVVALFSTRPLSRHQVHQRILAPGAGAGDEASSALGPGVFIERHHLQVVGEGP